MERSAGEPHSPPAPEPERLGAFMLDEWLVEPRLNRLTRHESVIHLRPQLLDLLSHLARHSERVVLKDEILEAVWPGQFVAESGLARCVAELRDALGDTPRDPRYIQTIHKRGYRIIAPVTWVATAAPPPVVTALATTPLAQTDGASDPDLSGGAAIEDAAGSTDRRDTKETPPPEADPIGTVGVLESTAPASPPAAATRRPRDRRFWLVAAFASTVVTAALAYTAGRLWHDTPLSSRDRVVLGDVANRTTDPDFDGTLRLALAVQLEQSPYLRLVPDAQVQNTLRLMTRAPDTPVAGPVAREVCEREGAKAVVTGSVARLGARYAIGLEATACASGDSLGRQLVTADEKEDVLRALGQAASALRLALGESLRSVEQYGAPVERATTSSLEALKLLSIGAAQRQEGRLSDAVAAMRRAVEVDPDFALAWARLGTLLVTLGEQSDGVVAIRRAYERRDRASEPERLQIEVHYDDLVTGDYDRAIRTCQVWRRTYPGSTAPSSTLASLYARVSGRYQEATIEARHVLERVPVDSLALSSLASGLLGLNRFEEAERELRRAVDLGADNPFTHARLYQIAFSRGDMAAMRREADWARDRDAVTRLIMLGVEERALTAAGRTSEARRLRQTTLAAIPAADHPDQLAALHIDEALAAALHGDRVRARASAETAIGLARQPSQVAQAMLALALAGAAERAAGLASALDARGPGDVRAVWVPATRAAIDLTSGRPREALRRLEAVRAYELGNGFRFWLIGIRALAHLSADEPDEALRASRTIIDRRGIAPGSVWYQAAHVLAARALARKTDRSQATTAYETFFRLWDRADPEIPLLRDAVSEYDRLRQVAAQPGPAPASTDGIR